MLANARVRAELGVDVAAESCRLRQRPADETGTAAASQVAKKARALEVTKRHRLESSGCRSRQTRRQTYPVAPAPTRAPEPPVMEVDADGRWVVPDAWLLGARRRDPNPHTRPAARLPRSSHGLYRCTFESLHSQPGIASGC